MSNVTIYLDDEIEARLRQAAKNEGTSVSKLVSRIIAEKTAHTWPDDFLSLAGTWRDLARPPFAANLTRETL